VGVVLRGRPETPRVVRERFWDLVRSGVAPGDAGWRRVVRMVRGAGSGRLAG